MKKTLAEGGPLSWIREKFTGMDASRLDELYHDYAMVNTPGKKHELLGKVQKYVDLAVSKSKGNPDPLLKEYIAELKKLQGKVRNMDFDYSSNESALLEGLGGLPAGTLYVRNYAAGGSAAGLTVPKPVIAGDPREVEVPLDSLSGKQIISVMDAVKDNAVDKLLRSFKDRAEAAGDNATRDALRAEARDKMLDAERIIRSAKTFANSERPRLVSTLHRFIDEMKAIEEKLSATDPDAIKRTMVEALAFLEEDFFGGRKYMLHKKDFAESELHNVIGNMALEGGLDAQRVKWFNRLQALTSAAERTVFVADVQKAIDTLGVVRDEANRVTTPQDSAGNADASEQRCIQDGLEEQIAYLQGLVAEANSKELGP